jgi:hypothetical protein
MDNKEYINSKIECCVCTKHYAKNYILVHLTKQHANIYGTPEWETSRYAKKFIAIKEAHKKLWGIIL